MLRYVITVPVGKTITLQIGTCMMVWLGWVRLGQVRSIPPNTQLVVVTKVLDVKVCYYLCLLKTMPLLIGMCMMVRLD